jgi:hypothetical protein
MQSAFFAVSIRHALRTALRALTRRSPALAVTRMKRAALIRAARIAIANATASKLDGRVMSLCTRAWAGGVLRCSDEHHHADSDVMIRRRRCALRRGR